MKKIKNHKKKILKVDFNLFSENMHKWPTQIEEVEGSTSAPIQYNAGALTVLTHCHTIAVMMPK